VDKKLERPSFTRPPEALSASHTLPGDQSDPLIHASLRLITLILATTLVAGRLVMVKR